MTPGCDNDSECSATERCLDRRCVARADAGTDAGEDTASDVAPDGADDAAVDTNPPCEAMCGGACCESGEVCWESLCIPDLGACTDNDGCWSDSRCVDGVCVPFGTPSGETSDDSCEVDIDIEAIEPQVQCRWTGPPAGDAFPDHVHVMATPTVVDLDLDGNPATLAPSIIFASFPTTNSYRTPGVLRIIDGATCEQQFTFPIPDDAVMSPAGVAAGDLDGDGRAEIVAARHAGGLIAFRFDAETGEFERLWTSATCEPTRTEELSGGMDKWGGPSIHDLDDDGSPEIIYGSVVFDRDGCRINASIGFTPYSKGVPSVIADVDEDGAVELVRGNSIFDFTAAGWVPASYHTPNPAFAAARGLSAVADLGEFPLPAFGGEDRAEVVTIHSGSAYVFTLEGTLVFGPVAIPGGGNGGAPTIADFDGDGRAEFATAGGSQYVVFDLDCVPDGDPAGCASGSTNGILWAQPSQDRSSNLTGSSVFDFDADGAAEAVYADECFLRIYDGRSGEVRFSAARSSGTTYENPVIVDVDGDFHSEIVSSVNDYAGTLGCPAEDPLRAGAMFERNHGIVVLRDVEDRWASSRPIWNQHAYAVTHVGDRGEIPQTRDVAINWRDPALNNFRQNVQGDLAARGLADLTARAISDSLRVPCAGGVGGLRARVCNRGSLPMRAGFAVSFRAGAEDGPELCRASSEVVLEIAACEEVSCDATLPPDSAIDVYVVVDPDGEEGECWEGNNLGLQPNVACETVD